MKENISFYYCWKFILVAQDVALFESITMAAHTKMHIVVCPHSSLKTDNNEKIQRSESLGMLASEAINK